MPDSPTPVGPSLLGRIGGPNAELGPMVELPIGVAIPRRFRDQKLVHHGDGRTSSWTIDVRVDEHGQPDRIFEMSFVAPEDGFDMSEVKQPDPHVLARRAVQDRIEAALQAQLARANGGWVQLADYVEAPGGGHWTPRAEALTISERARIAARKRGPYRITDEFLRDVLAWHGEGGVKQVCKEADVTERTARRWLAEAKDRGLR